LRLVFALPCDGHVRRRYFYAQPRPLERPVPRGRAACKGHRSGGARDPGRVAAPAVRKLRLEAIAKLLDIAFILPGTNIRYGIDGLIGLIPVVGDLITTAISLWLVREARALGAPWHITARMLANVALDGVVGMVPLAGDAFDVMFRANVRNVRLLKRWMDRQRRQ
jgi:Domain of unknown function (DUF4112)